MGLDQKSTVQRLNYNILSFKIIILTLLQALREYRENFLHTCIAFFSSGKRVESSTVCSSSLLLIFLWGVYSLRHTCARS